VITWAEKVKIWDLRYLKNTPIDRIRQELEAGPDGVAPSWDTVNRVVEEFSRLTQAQVKQLPDALRERWQELSPVRPDKQESLVIDKGKGRLRVLIGEEHEDLAARLKRDIEDFDIRDNYAVWQFPGNPWAFQGPERAEFKYTLDVIPYLGGSKVIGFKIENEKGCTVMIERMKSSFPDFATFGQFKGRLAELVEDCQALCREIWAQAEAVTGLKMGVAASCGYLIDVPFYIWRFALANYNSGKSPELEALPIDAYHAYLAPRERPGWALAVGLTQAMAACQEQTTRLCDHYARDTRIGELLQREKDLKKQADPLVQALTRAITAFSE
jgi:hypothetical protein